MIDKEQKLKKIWDNYVVVKEVQKAQNIKLVVAVGVRAGVKYINIREFYHRKRDDTWNPGRDGITIPVLLPIDRGTKRITPLYDFTVALAEATELMETIDLYDDNNAVYMPVKGKIIPIKPEEVTDEDI